ncbi:MAG: hypothetical protein QHH75_00745 [Bacillota bacterium]|nr:hypothetical protein [Bacillota bacterium]
MPLSEEKVIGEQILTKIDQLIELIIAAGMQNKKDRQELFKQGCLMMRELLSLLEQLLGPREDYLRTAVKELVMQRLPDQRVLNGFADFYDLLEEIYRKARPIKYSPPDYQEKTIRLPEIGSGNSLEQALIFLFPRDKIQKNYWYKGMNFQYFLPSLKFAVEDIAWNKAFNRARKEFFCRKHGIRFLVLDSTKAANYREVARIIKRQVSIPD